MKRCIILLLTVVMLLSMAACGGETVQQEAEPTEPPVTFLVPDPMERPQYTMDESATPRQMREMAVKAMRDMLSIQFSVAEDFQYNKGAHVSHKDYIYHKETIYAGLPYTEAQVNLFVWFDYYDPETGRLRMDGDGQWLNLNLGNTCGGSLMWGWSAVCDSLYGYYTAYHMLPCYGFVPVGSYTFDTTMTAFQQQTSKEICTGNGMDVMFQSYAQIQMADAVTSSTIDHVMMAVEDATVVYTADGEIDPNASYIIVQDQNAGDGDKFFEHQEGDYVVHYTGRLDCKMTFLDLYNSSYIPVTTQEFAGTKKYSSAQIKLSAACESMEQLLRCSVTSNYPMCILKINATAEDGKVNNLLTYYFDRTDVGNGLARDFSIPSNHNMLDEAIEKLAPGKYTVTVEATASTGEVFNLTSFQYSK